MLDFSLGVYNFMRIGYTGIWSGQDRHIKMSCELYNVGLFLSLSLSLPLSEEEEEKERRGGYGQWCIDSGEREGERGAGVGECTHRLV